MSNLSQYAMRVDETKPDPSYLKSWLVQKFGGTSIGKCPLHVVENAIQPAILSNHRVVVVCSARSNNTKAEGTTNRLLQAYRHCLKPSFDRSVTLVQSIRTDHINATHGYIKSPSIVTELVARIDSECVQLVRLLQAIRTLGCGTSDIRDKIISSGERLSCYFLSALLRDRNIASEVVDASQIVPKRLSSAVSQVFYNDLGAILVRRINACPAGTVPVVTGFFGPIEGGVIAKIGRGYTDLCASLIAVGLGVCELQVWKEVEGMFTADPGKVTSARMLPQISSAEAAELTFHGSEVIHYTAMRMVMRSRIPVRIKNVMNPAAAGTLITDDWQHAGTRQKTSSPVLLKPLEAFRPVSDDDLHLGALAVTSKDKILLINIRAAERLRPHTFFAGIFSVLDRRNLSIDLICTSEVQVSMALHSEYLLQTGDDEDDLDLERSNLKSAISQLQEYGNVEVLSNRTIVSVVGKRLKLSAGVAGRMFTVLSDNGINVEMIAQGASEISISCVIQKQLAERAVILLHSSLFATQTSAAVGVNRSAFGDVKFINRRISRTEVGSDIE